MARRAQQPPHVTRDLRDFLAAADDLGDVRTSRGPTGISKSVVSPILSAEKHGPILLCDAIKGYEPGYRVAANVLASPQRFALAMCPPIDLLALELLRLESEERASDDDQAARRADRTDYGEPLIGGFP